MKKKLTAISKFGYVQFRAEVSIEMEEGLALEMLRKKANDIEAVELPAYLEDRIAKTLFAACYAPSIESEMNERVRLYKNRLNTVRGFYA
jgi:hypothetical protein